MINLRSQNYFDSAINLEEEKEGFFEEKHMADYYHHIRRNLCHPPGG
jgi:hypothetical protein